MSTLSTQLLYALGALALYIIAKRCYKSATSNLKSIPRATGGHWLWGHEQDAWATPDAGFYTSNFEKSGHVFTMKGGLFSDDILAISDPAALSHMFTKHPYDYPKSAFIRPLVERLMGRSLPWAEGDEHKRQRAALAPVFTHENVKNMDPEVRHASEGLVNMLKEHITNNEPANKASGDETVEINALDWCCRATLQIIGSVGFGHDFQLGETEDAKAITESFRELVNIGMTPAGFIAPLVLRAFPFITDLPVKEIQAQGGVKVIVKRLAGEMVQEKRRMNGAEMKGKDLLSTLLRMQDLHGDELDQILDHIAMFTLVGHETSAAALNFTLYNLAHNKPAQDRLRQELRAFPSAEPSYDDYLNRLPILDAVTKEAMRIHPAVMHTERVAMKDDVLPLRYPIRDPKTGEGIRSLVIKKGQTIHVSHMAINRSKAIWGEDASEFKPERWMSTLPDNDNGKPGVVHAIPPPPGSTQGWNGTFTFVEGPRICIGLRLALFEYKVILADLIKNFEFLPVEGPDGLIETVFSSTGQPYVIGKKTEGVKIPLRVRCIHS
ncbi:hypothetical protein FRB94_013563 [Tulasnella sp. JGI-2019a]|nr:hypothetical protein FRB93_005095 [Tulasnella sp. JGI-2019a]KAG9014253.1 hypothetical protein FRB94_013563 [Tulasnella sp. JGI-2019a]KAG9035971.1 hypothetical protein FRB95_010179 [Tulasnella sp. JGI-2019a]